MIDLTDEQETFNGHTHSLIPTVTVTQARPRPLPSFTGERLERKTSGKVEVRQSDSGSPVIFGHAATFNSLTRIDDWFGSYLERVAPGAFAKTIADGADVRCLFNHDPNYVLGRTKSNTLTLREDKVGLAYEATPPDTQWARDLQTTMQRGDVDGSSFGFRIVRDKWNTEPDPNSSTDEPMDCRTILEAQLFDVSPVTFPAYAASESSIRSTLGVAGFDFDVIGRVLFRSDHGLTLSTHDRDQYRSLLDHLRRYLPADPGMPSAPVASDHAPELPTEAPTFSGHADGLLVERLARLSRAVSADRVLQECLTDSSMRERLSNLERQH